MWFLRGCSSRMASSKPVRRSYWQTCRLKGDHLLVGVSSQLRHEVKGLDEIISPTDQDYPASGLKVASLIRMGMIATLPSNAILGRVGSISSLRLTRLMGNFIAAMKVT